MNHLSPARPGILRERFIEDMTVRGFSEKTRRGYIRIVARFVAFLERSPATATTEDMRSTQPRAPPGPPQSARRTTS